jgi:A/G-specific adenine glycosylase
MRPKMIDDFTTKLTDWYDQAARNLPWRGPQASPWGVLVSEIMLQQTPVNRVLPVYATWLNRWPTPGALASDSPGEAVRLWGKLGYPRRALRLHACAVAITARFDGNVPTDVAELESLPGIGTYTARAVAVFAFGQRHPVVDTNVRRVVTRAVTGDGEAGPPSNRRDLEAVAALLPTDETAAARFSIALMELGALICTAKAPRCRDCPISAQCAWLLNGSPAYTGPTVRPQRFTGTDRQVRGLLMDVLRAAPGPVPALALDIAWHDPAQRARALDSLIADGLIDPLPNVRFALPS